MTRFLSPLPGAGLLMTAAAPSSGVFAAARLDPYSEEHADDQAWKEAIAPLSHIPQASQRAATKAFFAAVLY